MKLSLLAPAKPISNETRRLAWAERILQRISDCMGWEFSEVTPNTWRIRLPNLHWDLLLANSPKQLVKKANVYYGVYKDLVTDDPEKILPPL